MQIKWQTVWTLISGSTLFAQTCLSGNLGSLSYLQKLMTDRVNFQKRRDTFKKMMQQLSAKYEGLKAQLGENETFTQVMAINKYKRYLFFFIEHQKQYFH